MKNFLIILFCLSVLVTSCSKKVAGAASAPTKTSSTSTQNIPSSSAAKKDESDSKAIEVLKNYIDAIGGKEKLTGVKSMMTKTSATTAMGDLMITQYVKDGKSAMKTEMAGSTVMEQVFDGSTLMVSGMGGKQSITDPAAIKGARKQARMFDELDQLTSNNSLKKYLGIEDLDGKKVHKITITDADNNITTQYFDATSNFLVRTIASTEAMGQKSTQTMDMSDYRDVNGVKFPHSIKVSGGAMPFALDMKIVALMVNSDLPDQLFKIN
jgi:hypothetical protein